MILVKPYALKYKHKFIINKTKLSLFTKHLFLKDLEQ